MIAKPESRVMREPEGVLPNTLALGYAISAYLLGLFLLTRSSPTAVLPGILLIAHSMVIASYLIHECAHMSLFRARSMKRWTGELPFRQLLRTFCRCGVCSAVAFFWTSGSTGCGS